MDRHDEIYRFKLRIVNSALIMKFLAARVDATRIAQHQHIIRVVAKLTGPESPIEMHHTIAGF